jgi:TRAP-type mannitol/chloroaromatic compound transport system permease small subunit
MYLNNNWNSSFKFRFKFDKQLICFHKAANGHFNEEIRYARGNRFLAAASEQCNATKFLFFNLFSIYVSLNLPRFDLFHLCFFEPVAFQPSFFSNVRVRLCYKSWEQKLQCWAQMNVIAMHFNLLDFFPLLAIILCKYLGFLLCKNKSIDS